MASQVKKVFSRKYGFPQLNHDPCLFSRRVDDSVIIVGVYVDDVIVAHNGEAHLERFKTKFIGPDGIRAKHVGPLSWFLGVEVVQDANFAVTLSQSQYVNKLLDRFVPARPNSLIKHAMPCNPLTFPSLCCAKTDLELEKASKLPYLQLYRVSTIPLCYDKTRYLSLYVCTMLPYARSHYCSIPCRHRSITLCVYILSYPIFPRH